MAKWLDKYNTPEAQNGIEGTMAGLTDKGFNYNGAWGGTMAMGGSLPGSVGFTYARTQDPAPSNGKYAKKTMASAQNGQEMKFYQEGLDWKPKSISQWGGDYALDADQAIQTIVNVGDVMSAPQQGAVKALTGKYQMPSEALGIKNSLGQFAIDMFTDPTTYLGGSVFKKGIGAASKVASKVGKGASKLSKAASTFKKDFVQGYKTVPTREDGGIIEDDRGQWEYPGEITKINSNQITMQGVDYPVLGISDTGDTQMMQPGQDYTYDGESVTEYPMMQDGGLMSYREPILNAKDRFVQKQMNKFGDAKFVNRALEIAEKQGYDYGADDGGPLDAVRHAAMSASVAKNLKVPKVIGKYAPALDDAIRMGAANLMGFGYELSNFNEGEGFLMDMKNNYIGSDIGVMKNLTDEERAKKIAGMLKYNKLSIDNTKKPKKENGGWLSKYN